MLRPLRGRGLIRSRLPTALLLAVLLVLTGCTGSGETTAFTFDEETVYLDSVRTAEQQWREALNQLGQVVSRSYGTRSIMFSAFAEADFTEVNREILQIARELDPPTEYADDHRTWVEYRESIATTQLVDRALAEKDLLAFMAALDTVGHYEKEFFLSISPIYCRVILGHDPALTWRCPVPGPVPGGDYGEEVNRATREFALSTGNAFQFPVDMTDAERSERLGIVQQHIESAFEKARARIEPLTPPAEFEGDHASLLRYLRDQHAIAMAITEANSQGDDQLVQELFLESQGVFNLLVASISEEYQPLLGPFFGG